MGSPRRPAFHQSPRQLRLCAKFRWLEAVKLGVNLSLCSPISSTSAGPLSTDDLIGSDSDSLMLVLLWAFWSCRRIYSWCTSDQRTLSATMSSTHHRTIVICPSKPTAALSVLAGGCPARYYAPWLFFAALCRNACNPSLSCSQGVPLEYSRSIPRSLDTLSSPMMRAACRSRVSPSGNP
jgi:hypothetical protein